ncbi:MAG: hypothetical protein IT515_16035 [Burkholderiales bacterium]|nr:hypothetical protein [Burkholderiales bacterium]
MGKLLVLILVVLAAYALTKALAGPKRGARSGSPGAGARRRTGERMVPCAHCGLNVPESEALSAGGRFFCCDEHLRQFRQ